MTEEDLLDTLNARQHAAETFSQDGWKCEQYGLTYSAMRRYRQALFVYVDCLGITHELFDRTATSEFLELATQRIDDLKRTNNALRTEYDKEVKSPYRTK